MGKAETQMSVLANNFFTSFYLDEPKPLCVCEEEQLSYLLLKCSLHICRVVVQRVGRNVTISA